MECRTNQDQWRENAVHRNTRRQQRVQFARPLQQHQHHHHRDHRQRRPRAVDEEDRLKDIAATDRPQQQRGPAVVVPHEEVVDVLEQVDHDEQPECRGEANREHVHETSQQIAVVCHVAGRPQQRATRPSSMRARARGGGLQGKRKNRSSGFRRTPSRLPYPCWAECRAGPGYSRSSVVTFFRPKGPNAPPTRPTALETVRERTLHSSGATVRLIEERPLRWG